MGLANRDGGDDLVRRGVDRGHRIVILQADIDATAVARGPQPVRQRADRGRRDLGEVIGAKHLHDILGADRHIGELPARRLRNVDVVGDRTRREALQHREWRLGVEHHDLADVLQRQPYLLAIRRRSNVGAEGAFLLHPADDLLRRGVDHHGFGREAGADIAVLPVRREDRHAGTVRDGMNAAVSL